MTVCHNPDVLESPAAMRLRQFVREQAQAWQAGTPDFERFERELHEQVMALECELLAAELARYDVTADQIEVAGVTYPPVLTATETYVSAAGPVCVERHLYRPAGHNAKSLCPLELRVGILAGHWTPRAARLGSWAMAQLPRRAQWSSCLTNGVRCGPRAVRWIACRASCRRIGNTRVRLGRRPCVNRRRCPLTQRRWPSRSMV